MKLCYELQIKPRSFSSFGLKQVIRIDRIDLDPLMSWNGLSKRKSRAEALHLLTAGLWLC